MVRRNVPRLWLPFASLLVVVAIMLSACGRVAAPTAHGATSSPDPARETNADPGGAANAESVSPGTLLPEPEFVSAMEQTGASFVIIQVFAESCGPCITESLELDDRLDTWRDDDVAVLGLGMDDSPESVDAFFRQSGERIRFPLYCAPWFAEEQEVALTPTLFIYDKAGKQLFRADAESGHDSLLGAIETELSNLHEIGSTQIVEQ